MSLLEVSALGKSFAGRMIFEDVSLELDAGESVAIVGPSGTGKTTLLRCLNGLDRADQGSVRVGTEQLIAGTLPAQFEMTARAIRRRVGFVFQDCHLFSHRTVLENVIEAPVHVRGETVEAATRRAAQLLDTVEIAHRASAMPHQLSGGEQQRAAIARALAMQPEILLLDEPTSALDSERTDRLAGLLRELVAGGLSIIKVTHDLDFARALATRTFRLAEGRLVRL
jgi:ABC-type polar amino acid transport system ATPase subunit